MRRQLLRRLWHKEYRRLDRTGSLSPPLQRSLRSKRALRVLDNTSPEVCLECQKLEETQFNRSVPEITMKRIRHNNSITNHTASSSSSVVAFPRKAYSIETETISGHSILNGSSSSNSCSATTNEKSTPNGVSSNEMEIVNAVNMLHQMNGNFASSTEDGSATIGDESARAADENSFLIEIEDDRINITTTATAESTALLSESIVDGTTSDESSSMRLQQQQHHPPHQSINSRPSTAQAQAVSSNDDTNNNSGDDSKLDNVNNNNEYVMTRNATTDTNTTSSTDMEKLQNQTARSINDTLDQNAIDTIISQILVDSLNNIIVVQGKANQSNINNNNISTDSSENVMFNESQTQTDAFDENMSNGSSLPLPVTDQVYFPHYLSTETLSEYSTKLSNDSNAIELLPANLVISVISGSSYPLDGGEMIVHRLADIPRTESMEVQPSSAPYLEEEEHTKMNEGSDVEDENDDDTASLVDSLDDPNEIVEEEKGEPSEVIVSKPIVEKSQSFFVPIEGAETNDENVLSQPSEDVIALANAMPERLRERLQRRQIEISDRKEAEQKRRQEKIQKLISDHESSSKHGTSSTKIVSSSSFEVLPDNKSPTLAVRKSLPRSKGPLPKKNPSKKFLNSEIGLLESYTVDAQGNLQFTEQNSKSNGGKKITTVTGPVVKHVAIKKTTTTTTKPAKVKPPREKQSTSKSSVEKRSKVLTNGSTKHRPTEVTVSKKRTDVQKMTLVHHSPADMITPDRDCGPRRMYQKTEIREGAKRIEILEIVECHSECLNSSSESFQPTTQTSSSSSPQSMSSSQSLIERFTAKQTSKIPVAVPSKSKSRSKSVLNGSQQRTLKAQIRDSVSHHNGNISSSNSSINNSKVDQIIADLLIEALNHSTDIGIEFIKTPQNTSTQSLLKMNNVTKRVNLSTRRGNGMVSSGVSSGKRSAHSSAKYQQIFDSIPEEKSSSLSIDSPNEDISVSSLNDANVSTSSVGPPNRSSENNSKTAASKSSSSTKKLSHNSTGGSSDQTNGSQTKMASGKAAIESDQDKAETWFGCFGRTHVDSDALLMDEGIFKVLHKSSVAV